MARHKKLALFVAPVNLAGEIERLLDATDVRRESCDWVDDPRKLAATLEDNRYNLILATQSYNGASGTSWYLALRKLAPGAGLILFGEPGAEALDALRAAAARDPSFVYLPGGLTTEVLHEYLGAGPQAMGAEGGNFIAMQDAQYRNCKSIIDRLALQVTAHAIYLVDNIGIVLTHMEAEAHYPIGEIGSLLGGSFSALWEVGRLVEEPESGMNLIYRQGERNDFYALNVNAQLSLVLLIEREAGAAKMGTVWHYAQSAARALEEMMAYQANDAFDILLSEQANLDLESALDALTSSPAIDELGDLPAGSGGDLDGPISFELAVARGLIRAEQFESR
jgi:hypothetical protein